MNGRSPRARSPVVQSRDLGVLESLLWAGVLTTRQVEALHFPSVRVAERRLQALVGQDLVARHLQGDALHLPRVFTLTELGRDRLGDAGVAIEGPMRRMPRRAKLAHALMARDVFVAFVEIERELGVTLVDFRFEEDLVGDKELRQAGLIPDALAVTREGGDNTRERHTAVECDRATETTTTLRDKLTRWSAHLAASPGLELALVATTAGRAATLRRLAADVHLPDRAFVVELSSLSAHLRGSYAEPLFSAPIRAARIADPVEVAELASFHPADQPAFRRSPKDRT